MATQELVKEVEGGLMAEQRVPALASTDNTNSFSNAPTLTENHHLEKTATHSSHAKTDIAGEKGEKDVDAATPEDDSGLLSGARLYMVFLSLMLAVLASLTGLLLRISADNQMFALDQSIVATAIPVLVSDFNAFAQVPWVITG